MVCLTSSAASAGEASIGPNNRSGVTAVILRVCTVRRTCTHGRCVLFSFVSGTESCTKPIASSNSSL